MKQQIDSKLIKEFNKQKETRVGTTLVLANLIKNDSYSKDEIEEAFDVCIPKTDYARKERKEILEWLFSLIKK